MIDKDELKKQEQVLKDVAWDLMSTWEQVMSKLGDQEDENAKDQE